LYTTQNAIRGPFADQAREVVAGLLKCVNGLDAAWCVRLSQL